MRKINTLDAPPTDYRPTLVTASTIHAVDPAFADTRPTALLLAGDRIVAVGTEQHCREVMRARGCPPPESWISARAR